MRKINRKSVRAVQIVIMAVLMMSLILCGCSNPLAKPEKVKEPQKQENQNQTPKQTEDSKNQNQTPKNVEEPQNHPKQAGDVFATDDQIKGKVYLPQLLAGENAPIKNDNKVIFAMNYNGYEGQCGYADFPDAYNVFITNSCPTSLYMSYKEEGLKIVYIDAIGEDLHSVETKLVNQNEGAYVMELSDTIAMVRVPEKTSTTGEYLLISDGAGTTIQCLISTFIADCNVDETALISDLISSIRF